MVNALAFLVGAARGDVNSRRDDLDCTTINAQTASGQQSVLLGRTAATASDTRRVLVKVEEVK